MLVFYSPRALTLWCGIVVPCYQSHHRSLGKLVAFVMVLIIRCRNSTQQCLSPSTRFTTSKRTNSFTVNNKQVFCLQAPNHPHEEISIVIKPIATITPATPISACCAASSLSSDTPSAFSCTVRLCISSWMFMDLAWATPYEPAITKARPITCKGNNLLFSVIIVCLKKGGHGSKEWVDRKTGITTSY